MRWFLAKLGVCLVCVGSGPHTKALNCAAHKDAPCYIDAEAGQTGLTGEPPARDQRTPTQERFRRGRRTLGCSRLGRLVRMPSHVMEI